MCLQQEQALQKAFEVDSTPLMVLPWQVLSVLCDILSEIVIFAISNVGHAIQSALAKGNVDPALVDDVVLGCGMPEAETGELLSVYLCCF